MTTFFWDSQFIDGTATNQVRLPDVEQRIGRTVVHRQHPIAHQVGDRCLDAEDIALHVVFVATQHIIFLDGGQAKAQLVGECAVGIGHCEHVTTESAVVDAGVENGLIVGGVLVQVVVEVDVLSYDREIFDLPICPLYDNVLPRTFTGARLGFPFTASKNEVGTVMSFLFDGSKSV